MWKLKKCTFESNKKYDLSKTNKTFWQHWLQMYKWLNYNDER